MANRNHKTYYSGNALALTILLGLTVTLSGCSKNDDSSGNCRDLFTSNCLLSHGLQQGSSGNSAAQSQADATAGDSTSAKVATLSSTGDQVTPQAIDPDSDELVYKVLDRLPGSVVRDTDGRFIYTPSAEQRFQAAGESFRDRFEAVVSDRDSGLHLHGLPGLLDQFSGQHRPSVTVPIDFPFPNPN